METSCDPSTATEWHLARRLRELRSERHWSLDELARRSGVSRATLSRLENNEVSPTAAVLARLCAAYGLTMSRLLAQVEMNAAALVPARDQPLWIDPETGFRRRSVSPPSTDYACELLECELPAGVRIAYDAAPRPGLEHHLYLEAGMLEITIEGRSHQLSPGDCLRYRLYGASAFRTSARRGARYLLVIH